MKPLISFALGALVYLGLYPYVGWDAFQVGRAFITVPVVFAVLTLLMSWWFSLIDGLLVAAGVTIGALIASMVMLLITIPVTTPGYVIPVAFQIMVLMLVFGTGMGWVLSHIRALTHWAASRW